jgi:hypothetical protein
MPDATAPLPSADSACLLRRGHIHSAATAPSGRGVDEWTRGQAAQSRGDEGAGVEGRYTVSGTQLQVELARRTPESGRVAHSEQQIGAEYGVCCGSSKTNGGFEGLSVHYGSYYV